MLALIINQVALQALPMDIIPYPITMLAKHGQEFIPPQQDMLKYPPKMQRKTIRHLPVHVFSIQAHVRSIHLVNVMRIRLLPHVVIMRRHLVVMVISPLGLPMTTHQILKNANIKVLIRICQLIRAPLQLVHVMNQANIHQVHGKKPANTHHIHQVHVMRLANTHQVQANIHIVHVTSQTNIHMPHVTSQANTPHQVHMKQANIRMGHVMSQANTPQVHMMNQNTHMGHVMSKANIHQVHVMNQANIHQVHVMSQVNIHTVQMMK